MDVQTAFENLLRLVTDISFVPFAAGLVIVVTQVIKNAFQVEGNRAALIALLVQVAVWVGYSVFKARGMDAQFEQGIKAAETIITTLLSVAFPALLSGLATQSVYTKVVSKDVPGFRSGTPKTTLPAAPTGIGSHG